MSRRPDAQLRVHHGRDDAGSFCPASGGTGSRRLLEPGHLLGGANTLYLCAPAHDQRRLRGYFTALTQAVLSHAFTSATKSGRSLDPPLLVV